MSNVDKGDAETLLNVLKFNLHILTKLKVKSTQGFVKKEYAGFNNQRTGDGNTLLLTTGKRRYISTLKSLKVYKFEHFGNCLFDFLFRGLFKAKTERNILINIKVGEQSVTLKNGVQLPLVGRNTIDYFTVKDNIARIRLQKTCNHSERSCLTATGGT